MISIIPPSIHSESPITSAPRTSHPRSADSSYHLPHTCWLTPSLRNHALSATSGLVDTQYQRGTKRPVFQRICPLYVHTKHFDQRQPVMNLSKGSSYTTLFPQQLRVRTSLGNTTSHESSSFPLPPPHPLHVLLLTCLVNLASFLKGVSGIFTLLGM